MSTEDRSVETDAEIVSRRIRELMDEAGLKTVKQLAEHVKGISQTTAQALLSGIESKTRKPVNPTLQTLSHVAHAFGVSVVDLLADPASEDVANNLPNLIGQLRQTLDQISEAIPGAAPSTDREITKDARDERIEQLLRERNTLMEIISEYRVFEREQRRRPKPQVRRAHG